MLVGTNSNVKTDKGKVVAALKVFVVFMVNYLGIGNVDNRLVLAISRKNLWTVNP